MTSARPLIVMADGPDGPLPDPGLIASTAGLIDPEVVLGWVVRVPDWIGSTDAPVTTLLTGPGTRAGVESGRVRSLATRLSAVPALLAGRMRPAVAVVGAVAAGGGEADWYGYGSPGWAAAAARHADAVIIERWPGRPLPGAPPLGPVVAGRVVAVIDRDHPPDPPPQNRPGPAHRRIGELVADLIPEGATVQWGPGVVGASVVDALARPVRVRSGLVTEELVALASRGLLTGTAEAAYVWGGEGGEALRRMIETGTLKLSGVEHIHDISADLGHRPVRGRQHRPRGGSRRRGERRDRRRSRGGRARGPPGLRGRRLAVAGRPVDCRPAVHRWWAVDHRGPAGGRVHPQERRRRGRDGTRGGRSAGV